MRCAATRSKADRIHCCFLSRIGEIMERLQPRGTTTSKPLCGVTRSRMQRERKLSRTVYLNKAALIYFFTTPIKPNFNLLSYSILILGLAIQRVFTRAKFFAHAQFFA